MYWCCIFYVTGNEEILWLLKQVFCGSDENLTCLRSSKEYIYIPKHL